jgi:hypothetical protein
MTSTTQWYVEVVYPNEYLVHETAWPWYWKHYAGEGKRYDGPRPHEPAKQRETFLFESRENAEKFAKYTAEQFNKWADACQGEAYVMRILQNDLETEVDRIVGTFGSKKPA